MGNDQEPTRCKCGACPCCNGTKQVEMEPGVMGMCPTCAGTGRVTQCKCGESYFNGEARWWYFDSLQDIAFFRITNGGFVAHCPGECGCRLSVGADGMPEVGPSQAELLALIRVLCDEDHDHTGSTATVFAHRVEGMGVMTGTAARALWERMQAAENAKGETNDGQ